jgi:hypothetical protein
MKTSVRFAILGAVVTLFVSIVGLTTASAQTSLTSEQLDRISANCLSIKNTLNQLHASDALLRVNRGQIYEAMSTKLMDRFNTRLSSNSLDASGTTAVTTSYRTALATFRTDYQAYERQLSTAIKIDCSEKPAEFHVAIEDARSKRDKVHDDVIRLHRYIDDYRRAVNDFYINFQRVSGE